MDINIRKAIIDNFKNFSSDELHQTINEAVKSKEELPFSGDERYPGLNREEVIRQILLALSA